MNSTLIITFNIQKILKFIVLLLFMLPSLLSFFMLRSGTNIYTIIYIKFIYTRELIFPNMSLPDVEMNPKT